MDKVLHEKARRLVNDEVLGCASILIDALAKEYDGATNGPLADLVEQAYELTAPVTDYESAAYDAGWRYNEEHKTFFQVSESGGHAVGYPGMDYDDWQDLCDLEGIEPYEREVYEHWIVSHWLGERLADMGEKVDFDFAGLVIWARTTTGQAICMDYVIQQIAKDLADA